ncbi:DNA ligase [Dissostichus eleginoides]|uniref:DNA ligase n=1 Tax=Dissostichus eleginoides TaxID=100907 RepID=A0AAD9FC76_DISEL|nr:DNA ligase [Dissostichus eleginoides]
MGAKAQRWSMDSGSCGADKAPFRGPRPGDNGWARLSPLLHSSTQRLILQMGFPVAGRAKRRALLNTSELPIWRSLGN